MSVKLFPFPLHCEVKCTHGHLHTKHFDLRPIHFLKNYENDECAQLSRSLEKDITTIVDCLGSTKMSLEMVAFKTNFKNPVTLIRFRLLGSILKALKSKFGSRIDVKLEIKTLSLITVDSSQFLVCPVENINVSGGTFIFRDKMGSYFTEYETEAPQPWENAIIKSDTEAFGKRYYFSFTLNINIVIRSYFGRNQLFNITNAMLNTSGFDVSLRTLTGQQIGCYSGFLTSQSRYFNMMLNNGNWIETQSQIIHTDMSTDCVLAFKRYLYTRKVGNIDFSTARELLLASKYYEIPELQDEITKVISNADDEYFDVNTTMDLFQDCQNTYYYCIERILLKVLKRNMDNFSKTKRMKQFTKRYQRTRLLLQFLSSEL